MHKRTRYRLHVLLRFRYLFTVLFFSCLAICLACEKNKLSQNKDTAKKTLVQPPPIAFSLPGGLVLDLVYIPATTGPFMMGSNNAGISEEYPAHPVSITKSFYMAKFETTQAQWMAIMKGSNPSQFSLLGGRSSTDDLTRPVEGISWDQTSEFISALNKLPGRPEGMSFRLPTEAEWEYACRAGSTEIYSFGGDIAQLKDYEWYQDNSGDTTHGTNDLKKPNTFGLYNMQGNISEYVQDMFSYYSNAEQIDPLVTNGVDVVVRGGDWQSEHRNCSVTSRGSVSPKNPGLLIPVGFRVVLAQIK